MLIGAEDRARSLGASLLRRAASNRRWAVKGGLSFADQAIFSGANFTLNILLARWLPMAAYGAFSIAFAIFLFASGFHNSLVLEPMTVLGPSNYRNSLSSYIGIVVSAQTALTILIAAASLLGCLWIPDTTLASACGALALSSPLILLLWVARRLAYIHIDPARAVRLSATYAVSNVLLLSLLRWAGPVTCVTGPLTMGAASLIALGVQWSGLGMPKASAIFNPSVRRYARVLREHWSYGKWACLASALYTATTQFQILVAGWLGLETAATLRAMQNFVLPMAQVCTAASTLALPVLARDYGVGDIAAVRRKARTLTVALCAVGCVYEMCLLVGAKSIERICYGGKFAHFWWLLPLLGLQPLFGAVGSGYYLVLRALQRPNYITGAYAIGAPATILSCLVLVRVWGLAGAGLSILIGTLASSIAVLYYARVAFRDAEASVTAWVPVTPAREAM